MLHQLPPLRRVLAWVLGALALNLAVGLSLTATVQSAPASVITVCNEANFTTALSGGGTITFNCNGNNDPATIVVSSQKALVTGTTIDGGGVITISGNYSVSLFSLGSSKTATITNLLLTGAGGSNAMVIFSDGTLNVTNTKFISNTGMAIFSRSGLATLTNSVISDTNYYNTLLNDASLTLNNTTVMGNSGTIFARGGTTTLNNSTVSGNGQSFLIDAALHLNNATVVNNGGALYDRSGVTTSKNSIIANNSGGNCLGPFASNGYNLASTSNCGLTQTTDFPNTNPLLGPLQDNGGPTWTHLPLVGSRAIDGGSCVFAADQRGRSRPGNGTVFCDIGATEFPTVTVDAQISKFVTPTVVAPNMPLTYTIVFSNVGSGRAAGVAITDSLPKFLTNLNVSSDGAIITATPGITFAWQLSSLPGVSSGHITVTGIVRSDASAGTFTNTAVITSSNEFTATNDSASAAVAILTSVKFSSAAYSVAETDGAALITVTLSVSSTATTTVDYATGGGTAVPGTNYTTTNGTLTFVPGVTSMTFTVLIIDNFAPQPNKTVLLTLSNPGGALLSLPNPATLTILNIPPPYSLFLPMIQR